MYDIADRVEIRVRILLASDQLKVLASNQYDSTTLKFYTADARPGDYKVIIESYDSLESLQTTVKTDTITVKVLPILGFSKGLQQKTLTAGVKESWSLPPITKISYELNDVSVQAPDAVADLIESELN